jgi:Flp pilus assembly protein TadB
MSEETTRLRDQEETKRMQEQEQTKRVQEQEATKRMQEQEATKRAHEHEQEESKRAHEHEQEESKRAHEHEQEESNRAKLQGSTNIFTSTLIVLRPYAILMHVFMISLCLAFHFSARNGDQTPSQWRLQTFAFPIR